MSEAELLQILARGEDSQHQFKSDITNADALAAELIALANSAGGDLYIGVADNGRVSGLTAADVARLNQLLSNAASQNMRPPINPQSANIQTAQGLVMQVSVAEGLAKPYMDTQGRIWVKSGADKRHVTAREEMQRLFQQSGLLQADQVPVRDATIADIDERAFARYFERRYKQTTEQTGLALPALFENLKLASSGVPNLAGVLLFGKNPQRHLQVCIIGAVCFPGTKLSDHRYLDSENIEGSLEEQYQRGLAFIKRNLHHVQGDQGFNSLGQLEVPEEAFVELLVNALVHRDFFTNATVRLFVFTDRVEIISPGHLPDTLTAEQIRAGTSNRRNKVLAEHAAHILPYRGLGTGIPRALGAWPKIDLLDEREANQFRAVVWRPVVDPTSTQQVTGQGRTKPESQPESQPESLEKRVLRILITKTASKAEISAQLGQKEVSGHLNKVVRDLLTDKTIEYTLPDKPNSRLQKYRLTERGLALLADKNSKGLA